MPDGGAVVLGWSSFGGGTGVGADPKSADGLAVVRQSTTRERDPITSRSVSRRSTSVLTTLGSPARERSMRAPKRERSEFTMTKIFAIVLSVMLWSPLNRRQARLM